MPGMPSNWVYSQLKKEAPHTTLIPLPLLTFHSLLGVSKTLPLLLRSSLHTPAHRKPQRLKILIIGTQCCYLCRLCCHLRHRSVARILCSRHELRVVLDRLGEDPKRLIRSPEVAILYAAPGAPSASSGHRAFIAARTLDVFHLGLFQLRKPKKNKPLTPV
jgi:hypothetical protein